MAPVLAQSLGAAAIVLSLAAFVFCSSALWRAATESRDQARAFDLRRLRLEREQARSSGLLEHLGPLAQTLAPLLGMWLGSKLRTEDDDGPPSYFGCPSDLPCGPPTDMPYGPPADMPYGPPADATASCSASDSTGASATP